MFTTSIIIIVLIIIGLMVMLKGDYPVVGVLILTNITVFFVQWLQYNFSKGDSGYLMELGFSAETLVSGSQPWTLITNMFVHGGFLHILGNMLFLALLGMPFEDRIGSKKFAIIYFSSGIAANIIDALITILRFGGDSFEAEIIGIGASGAIFGIMGAFAVLYPRDEIPMILGPIFLSHVPVFVAAMSYGLFEVFATYVSPADNIGHVAHVVGFVSGVALGPMIAQVRERQVSKRDYGLLRELLKSSGNAGLENTIDKLIKAEIPEVREAWWENLLKKAVCPQCGNDSGAAGGGGLGDGGHGLKCEKCGYVLDLRKRKG